METTSPAAEPAPEKKSVFDTIVISTPVILTVVATFILGRSSSEMTQAQYQRAVASQNQSKVADQWAFFQAKRIRGTTYEVTADLLASWQFEAFSRDSLLDTSEQMVREIAAAETRVGTTKFAAQKPEGTEALRTELRALTKKAERARDHIKAALSPPQNGWKGKRVLVTPESLVAALHALDHYPVHKAEQKSDSNSEIDSEQRQILDAILDDIRKFKPEHEIAPKTIKLSTKTLDKAMESARARAATVAERGKAIERVLEELDVLVESQAALSRDFHRALNSYLAAMKKAESSDPDVATFKARLLDVGALSAKLQGDYKAARHTFNAHRYEDDARSNQEAAYLYDIQVLQSSARSDKHLQRSFMFMLAMLVAQVGVTIATLALMLKFKLPVWAIAVLSGITAIAFGVCVYLEMMPV